MKKIVCGFLFVVGGFVCVGQTDSVKTNTFKLSDTTFKVGALLRAYSVMYDLSKPTLHPICFPFLDSVADFLLKHPNLSIEISRHEKTSPESSIILGKPRADAIRDYLVSKGVDKARLKAVSYGDTKPIIPQSEIDKTKSKEEKEKMMLINRRTEFKIISI